MEKLYWNIFISDDQTQPQYETQIKLILSHVANILDGLSLEHAEKNTHTYQINVAYTSDALTPILTHASDAAHLNFKKWDDVYMANLIHQSDLAIFIGEIHPLATQLTYTLPIIRLHQREEALRCFWLFDGYHIEYASHMLKSCMENVLITGAQPITLPKLTGDGTAENRIDALYEMLDAEANTAQTKSAKNLWYKEQLPLWISIVLAIGFYAEKLLGWQFGSPVIGTISVLGSLAAIGFLLHGIGNGLQLRINFSKKIKAQHQSYISQRYIAELLRVYRHLKMAGLPFDLATINCHPNLKRTLRQVIREDGFITLDDTVSPMDTLESLIDTQIEYHKDRIQKVNARRLKLQTYIKWFTQLGIVMVLLRSVLQVVLQYHPISGTRFTVSNNDALKSFLNMLALMLPAIASYFSNMMSLHHHQEQVHMSEHILYYLSQARHKIHQSKQNLDIDLSHRYYLSREIQSVLVQELGDWYRMMS